ncbi:MAG: Ig-like domain-containing protein [Chloroflexi bacterium]|nr:Ig-like domain-containing protein [Chloroflexota bacterium]
MRRFTLGVAGYLLACAAAVAILLIRGDGPHPRITALYPRNGDLYFPGGPAQITFSQPMDEASVERAVQVSPAAQGQGAWFGTTLNLQPVGDWRSNVVYHVSLTGKVTDAEGRPLRTPVLFWFRVHHIRRVGFCVVRQVRNVCETTPGFRHPLTHSSQPVLQYALSADGSTLAYTRRDASGLPHLFLADVDTGAVTQLTRGRGYADSRPSWPPGDQSSVTYHRRPVAWRGNHPRPGRDEVWNVDVDGSNNLRMG